MILWLKIWEVILNIVFKIKIIVYCLYMDFMLIFIILDKNVKDIFLKLILVYILRFFM